MLLNYFGTSEDSRDERVIACSRKSILHHHSNFGRAPVGMYLLRRIKVMDTLGGELSTRGGILEALAFAAVSLAAARLLYIVLRNAWEYQVSMPVMALALLSIGPPNTTRPTQPTVANTVANCHLNSRSDGL